MNKNPVHNSQ